MFGKTGPTPDGFYLIYMIGGYYPETVADCSQGIDPEWIGAGDWCNFTSKKSMIALSSLTGSF